jgi:hypothetical protein
MGSGQLILLGGTSFNQTIGRLGGGLARFKGIEPRAAGFVRLMKIVNLGSRLVYEDTVSQNRSMTPSDSHRHELFVLDLCERFVLLCTEFLVDFGSE